MMREKRIPTPLVYPCGHRQLSVSVCGRQDIARMAAVWAGISSGDAADSGCEPLSVMARGCAALPTLVAQSGCAVGAVFDSVVHVQCMQDSAPLAQVPMSRPPLFLPLPLCHIESNAALIVEVQEIENSRPGWAGGDDGSARGLIGRCRRALGVAVRC